MHKCLKYNIMRTESFEEEYPWSIALYIELYLNFDKEVVVCRHPVFTVIDDIKEFAERICCIKGDEIDVVTYIAKLLDSTLPSWRTNFEMTVRKGFILIVVYL